MAKALKGLGWGSTQFVQKRLYAHQRRTIGGARMRVAHDAAAVGVLTSAAASIAQVSPSCLESFTANHSQPRQPCLLYTSPSPRDGLLS
eukprot:6200217-Pleurochrysis_carterae.AAC.2